MTEYDARKLSGQRLQRCYQIAPPRVRQYLEAEIQHVLGRLRPQGAVLELGCGCGRVTARLAEVAGRVVGVDVALDSLEEARRQCGADSRCELMCMDARWLHFGDGVFDHVICIQNGIGAFRADEARLVAEALRVTRPSGTVLFSSYSDQFWDHRLAWLEAQAAEGLVGPVDRTASGDGRIVCADGFTAGRMTPEGFHSLCTRLGVEGTVTEVDQSSVFCEITRPPADLGAP